MNFNFLKNLRGQSEDDQIDEAEQDAARNYREVSNKRRDEADTADKMKTINEYLDQPSEAELKEIGDLVDQPKMNSQANADEYNARQPEPKVHPMTQEELMRELIKRGMR